MSLTDFYNAYLNSLPKPPPPPVARRKRLAPFSLRLTEEERARLTHEAMGAPLGTYIKAKVLGSAVPVRMRQSGLAVHDRESLAKVLALLGNSRLSSNLNQLAKLANTGSLPMTPETEVELKEAVRDVRSMSDLLMRSLGLKSGGAQ